MGKRSLIEKLQIKKREFKTNHSLARAVLLKLGVVAGLLVPESLEVVGHNVEEVHAAGERGDVVGVLQDARVSGQGGTKHKS